ncbi:MAG TPA: MoaD/ThiS family protein [Phycisphaerae bacterium]|nr:MoaD/ThiS family protein [Phycisphaerae bacterium]
MNETVRVVLPYHLRTLARVDGEVQLDVPGAVTQNSILTALEQKYPPLAGAIRDHVTRKRRPMIRFFACEEDVSNDPPDAQLPAAIATGAKPFYVIGAIAGG